MFEFSHAKKHMIHEIQAKVMLAHIKQPDPWFGLKYNMNLYRGCPHQCISDSDGDIIHAHITLCTNGSTFDVPARPNDAITFATVARAGS
ncbi:MAG TPA: hypothetical protein VHO69_07495, partial [Phototrophicaceae bacterium]|nr:hypothetical protein [Phototrophicaceae bacterium]